MLKCNNESEKRMVESIIGLRETCNYFPMDPSTDYYDEYNDRVYIDGVITFEQMAEIVDYLRACNPDKK